MKSLALHNCEVFFLGYTGVGQVYSDIVRVFNFINEAKSSLYYPPWYYLLFLYHNLVAYALLARAYAAIDSRYRESVSFKPFSADCFSPRRISLHEASTSTKTLSTKNLSP